MKKFSVQKKLQVWDHNRMRSHTLIGTGVLKSLAVGRLEEGEREVEITSKLSFLEKSYMTPAFIIVNNEAINKENDMILFDTVLPCLSVKNLSDIFQKCHSYCQLYNFSVQKLLLKMLYHPTVFDFLKII